MSRAKKKQVNAAKQKQLETEEFVALQTNTRSLQARTPNQQKLMDSIEDNSIIIVEGKPGSGKTCISVGMALKYLKTKAITKIVICRPLVQSGEDVGTLPGDIGSKMHPYLLPIYDEFLNFITKQELTRMLEDGRVEICPLGLMRGRTFGKTFVILDEAQNATYEQLKMFITRIGMSSKSVMNGDSSQSDLPRHKRGGLNLFTERLKGIEGIGICKLESCDIVRNPIISRIIERLDDGEKHEDSRT